MRIWMRQESTRGICKNLGATCNRILTPVPGQFLGATFFPIENSKGLGMDVGNTHFAERVFRMMGDYAFAHRELIGNGSW